MTKINLEEWHRDPPAEARQPMVLDQALRQAAGYLAEELVRALPEIIGKPALSVDGKAIVSGAHPAPDLVVELSFRHATEEDLAEARPIGTPEGRA
jgi:hypothetical protein